MNKFVALARIAPWWLWLFAVLPSSLPFLMVWVMESQAHEMNAEAKAVYESMWGAFLAARIASGVLCTICIAAAIISFRKGCSLVRK